MIIDGPKTYYFFRLILGLASVVVWAWILVRVIKRVRWEKDADRRLWLATIVYLLLLVTLLLLFSSIYNYFHPPVVLPDLFVLGIGLTIQVSLVFGGVVLLSKWPPPPSAKP